MSILKSFVGALAANAASEIKQAEKERQTQQKNEVKVLDLQIEFNDYLRDINCANLPYVEINEMIEPGDVYNATRIIKRYKDKLKEYMHLGGDPAYICELDKMDLYIEIVGKLKEYDWLDKQDFYVLYAEDSDVALLDSNWEAEQRERHKTDVLIPKLLNDPNNELKQVIHSRSVGFIPYEPKDGVVALERAYFSDETTPSFYHFLDISITFSNQYIIVYNRDHDKMYFKSNVFWKEVEFFSFLPTSGFNEIVVNDTRFIIDDKYTKELEDMYLLHNFDLQERNQRQLDIAYANINSLTGIEFEKVCKRLLENMGFEVEITKTTGDGGIDLIAYNKQPLLSGKYIIQCKRYTGSVGEPIIRDLYGVITSERANKGILMTSGVFTKQAELFADEKPIELIDGIKLKELIAEYC